MTARLTADDIARWSALSLLLAGLLGVLVVLVVPISHEWIGWSVVDRSIFSLGVVTMASDILALVRFRDYRSSASHVLVGSLATALVVWPFVHDLAIVLGCTAATIAIRALQRRWRKRFETPIKPHEA